MAYAVLRTQKLKSYGKISATGQHLSRERECLHADPELKHLNEIIIGSDNALKDSQDRARELGYKTQHNEEGKNYRKNGVLAIEYVMTASQDFFTNKTEQELRNWVNENRKFLEDKHGKENVINLTLHRDEQTPHLHAIVIPVDGKGKINASYYLDGKKKLNELQTNYAKAMKPYGLERGLEGSKAKHTTVNQFYTVANQNVKQGKNIVQAIKETNDLEKLSKSLSQDLQQIAQRRDNAEKLLQDVANGRITPQQLKAAFEKREIEKQKDQSNQQQL